MAWVECDRVDNSGCDRPPVGPAVAALEEAELAAARVDGLRCVRIDGERGDGHQAETGVCCAPFHAAIAALEDATPAVDAVECLRCAGRKRERRVLALGVANSVRGAPAATAVDTPEDTQATGRRIDRLRVERVDDKRRQLPRTAVTAVASRRRVHDAPAKAAIKALHQPTVRAGVHGLRVSGVDRNCGHRSPRHLLPVDAAVGALEDAPLRRRVDRQDRSRIERHLPEMHRSKTTHGRLPTLAAVRAPKELVRRIPPLPCDRVDSASIHRADKDQPGRDAKSSPAPAPVRRLEQLQVPSRIHRCGCSGIDGE